jgi:DNA-binding beta-propeller fold protein YncE
MSQHRGEFYLKERCMFKDNKGSKQLLHMPGRILSAVLFLLFLAVGVVAQEDIVDFESDQWILRGSTVVTHLEQKSLRGSAFLKGVEFQNGVIDVDMTFDGTRAFGGIVFRMKMTGDYEQFYIRPHKSRFPDALQYTPVTKGLSSWQLFSGDGFTAAAEIPWNQWIHVKLEVSGTQARVYLDHAEKPALVVHDLKHGLTKGTVGLIAPNTGQIHFANFRFKEDNDLVFDPPPETSSPAGMITDWEISQSFKIAQINRELAPDKQDLPEIKWKKVESDPMGLVDIARSIMKVGQSPDCVLARTIIHSEIPQLKKLTFGYSDEVSIFLNGEILFRGDSAFQKRDPLFQGIVGLNDSVFLPLKKGSNELLLIVTETFGGWGFICQLRSPVKDIIQVHEGLTQQWETPVKLQMPESVCYDTSNDVLYISNFGADYISKVSPAGKIIAQKWVTGLARPTGLSFFQNKLYAADRQGLVEIDIETAKITQKYPIQDVGFANDVAVHPSGDIYISDSQKNIIYRFKNGKMDVWLESDQILDPNGLYADKDRLIVGTSRDGCFKSVRFADKKIQTILRLGAGAIMDGVKPDGQGRFIMGDWTGRLYRVAETGEKIELLNTQEAAINLADFEYIQEKKLLVIPTLAGNEVIAYKIVLD